LDGYKTSTIKRNQGPQRTAWVGNGCKAPRISDYAGVLCPVCEGRCTKKLHRLVTVQAADYGTAGVFPQAVRVAQ
ncbi:MAG TPA: hypothetical protein PLR92_04015, partial [Alicycliphilus denitrificans]|nr:hypothetical protein [Alicycliphilus denitrificans]